MGNKSEQRKFACQTCGASYSFQSSLSRHKKTHKETDEVLEPTRSGSSTRNNRRSCALVLRVEEPEEEILDLEIVEIC